MFDPLRILKKHVTLSAKTDKGTILTQSGRVIGLTFHVVTLINDEPIVQSLCLQTPDGNKWFGVSETDPNDLLPWVVIKIEE